MLLFFSLILSQTFNNLQGFLHAMDSKKDVCLECRECCKFLEEDLYFSPIFTEEEVNKIKKKFKVNFKPYKDSKNVFQIEMVKSIEDEKLYVCPLLDEEKHLCQVYPIRPFDCRVWPFIFMKDKSGKKVVFACFDKDICPVTDKMDRNAFEMHKDEVIKWINKHDLIKLLNKHPALIWDYEADTFVISELEKKEKQKKK